MPGYELRPVRDEDRGWAYELKRDAYLEVVERQFGGPWDECRQRSSFDEKWEPAISKIICAEGEDVGLVAIREHSDHVWIDEIQIIGRWRGRGIGRAVLRDILADAKRSGRPVPSGLAREPWSEGALREAGLQQHTWSTETHHLMEKVFTNRR